VMVDPSTWDRPATPRPAPAHLDDVQAAVIEGAQVRLAYAARDGAVTERVVHPLGVVAKGTVWYLLAGTDAGLRTFRVDRVRCVEQTGAPVVRPDGFDLATEWRAIAERVDRIRAPFEAVALAEPWAVHVLRFVLGTRVAIGAGRADGRVEVELRGHRAETLAAEIAGLGAAVEVLGPPELRARLARTAAELGALYASSDS